MNNLFSHPIRFIDNFILNFKPVFSNTQIHILRNMLYAMFFDYKRLSLFAIAKRSQLDYQKLQYFFSESEWDINQLNNIRLKILHDLPPLVVPIFVRERG